MPKDVPLLIQNKLVNYYVSKLKSDPSLHDKIEFEIAINCLIFDFEKELTSYVQIYLTKKKSKLLKRNI